MGERVSKGAQSALPEKNQEKRCKVMKPSIPVSAAVSEKYVAKAREVMESFGVPQAETYGMDLDCITKMRLIREIDPEFGPSQTVGEGGKLQDADGRYTMEEWAEVVQVLKFGSNANAVNNRLRQSKGVRKVVDVKGYAGMV